MTDPFANRATLGARLKEAREYAGYSQEDVAGYLGIPRSAVSLIESGLRRLDVMELEKLAELYKRKVDDFVGRGANDAEPESVKMIARAATALSAEDRAEVLRFAHFLRERGSEKER
jgi:transcriptional regulator with XRE-family HTH domain